MFHLHLKSVLAPEYCRELIDEAIAAGFEQAKVNSYGKQKEMSNIRNNERREWDDVSLARRLEGMLIERAADEFPFGIQDRMFAGAGSHFRMYRYRPGQYFKPHRDGQFRLNELKSFVTVLFYLNDTDGGETILMPTSYLYRDNWITVKPEVGDVLLFEHDFWHEGRPVLSGEKYVLRTDLFYRG